MADWKFASEPPDIQIDDSGDYKTYLVTIKNRGPYCVQIMQYGEVDGKGHWLMGNTICDNLVYAWAEKPAPCNIMFLPPEGGGCV